VLEYTTASTRCRRVAGELELTPAELKRAFERLPRAARRAAGRRRRVRSYHEAQKKACGESWSYRDADGTLLGQKVTPLDRVGIYVPGGKAAYPSSVLMNAIPAQVAGVGEIIMVVPTPRGEKNRWCWPRPTWPASTRAFTIGGAQASARWPTARDRAARRQDHRPGNAYVASAKRRVFGQVGIDMIAGPSEILVLADGSTPPTGWRWTCSRRPSTTSWRRASCCAPTPATSSRCRRPSTGC
jgi:histidinol dehydrogenase